MPLIAEFSAAARSSASTIVNGTLMTRKMPTCLNDACTSGSDSARTKLSKPTKGRSAAAPGAEKEYLWKAIQTPRPSG